MRRREFIIGGVVGVAMPAAINAATPPPRSRAWSAIPDIRLNAGASVSLAQYYRGPPGVYAATKPLPAGVTLDATTGLLSASANAVGAVLAGVAFTVGAVDTPPPVVVRPPGIVPPPSPIPAPAGMFERRSVVGPPNGFGGAAKHLRFCKVGSLYYKVVGDHVKTDRSAASPDTQGGRQEIHSLNLATNEWKMHEPYWPKKPAGSVALFVPDDGAACTVRDEIWVFVSARNGSLHQDPWTPGPGSLTAPAGCARYYTDQIMAYNPATKLWRVISPLTDKMVGNRSWHAAWDPVKKHVLVTSNQGNGDDFWLVLDDVTGATLAQWRVGPSTKGYGHSGGLVLDVPARKGWAWETTYSSGVFEVNLDTGAQTQIAVCPEPGTGITESSNIFAGPTKSGKLLFYGQKLHVLTLATGAWQTVAREDAFTSTDGARRYCLTAFYDVALDAVCTIGAVDWSAGEDIGAYFLTRA